MSFRERFGRTTRHVRLWVDLAAALGVVLAVGTFLSIDQTYSGFPVFLATLLAGIGYVIGCSIACLVWLIRHRWARACASAAKAILFVLMLPACFAAGDYIHLALFYPSYYRRIAAQDPGDATPIRFFWGDKARWVIDGLQADTLIYDPADTFAGSLGEIRQGKGEARLWTRHLIGHFYVEREF